MPLESSVIRVADLNANWPIASDAINTMDDHLRNIKVALAGVRGLARVSIFFANGTFNRLHADVKSIFVECWGAGGSGGAGTATQGGGGGGGGAYAAGHILIDGTPINFVVGQEQAGQLVGTTGQAATGGDTNFGSGLLVAAGGLGGGGYLLSAGVAIGGAGGSCSGSANSVGVRGAPGMRGFSDSGGNGGNGGGPGGGGGRMGSFGDPASVGWHKGGGGAGGYINQPGTAGGKGTIVIWEYL